MNQMLGVKDLRTDGGTQPRAAVDFKLVADYAEAMQEGATFPPVTAFYDGTDYWLADGFHRLFAAKKIKAAEINAEVVQGTRRDAILHSFGVNEAHGFRRTADDKRRAVIRMLEDHEWSKLSLSQISKACKVSVGLVHKVFHDPEFDFSREKSAERTGADGRTINTANIGKQKADDFSREKSETPAPSSPGMNYRLPVTPEQPEEDDRLEYDDSGEGDNFEPDEFPASAVSKLMPPKLPIPDVRQKPEDPSKRRPFTRVFIAAGELANTSDDLIVDALLSQENTALPTKGSLEVEFQRVVDKIARCLKRAEIEGKTLEVVG